jgi:predicted short-subunit dehydrogenase-like oxidoreductase (DUF2520 family)
MSNESNRPDLRGIEAELSPIAVIGAGRLGTTMASALRERGSEVVGPLGRGQEPVGADVALICVPDDEIPAAARVVGRAARLVGHTSGASRLDALEAASRAGAEVFGLHPLQTFPRAEEDGPAAAARMVGAGAAVAGSSPAAVAVAEALVDRLGMEPFEVRDGDRAAYHAAASIASNFLVTLHAAVEEVAAGAGMGPDRARRLFAPLVDATVAGCRELGPAGALTGPVARGDWLTVGAQRAAIGRVAPEHLKLFDALVERTRTLAAADDRRTAAPAAPTVEVGA